MNSRYKIAPAGAVCPRSAPVGFLRPASSSSYRTPHRNETLQLKESAMGDELNMSPGRRGHSAHLDRSFTQSLNTRAVWRPIISDSKGMVVAFPDGRIALDDRLIIEEGADITTTIDVGDDCYDLYRYTLTGVGGVAYGYIAALAPPDAHTRRLAAQILFGPRAFGVERVEQVRGTV